MKILFFALSALLTTNCRTPQVDKPLLEQLKEKVADKAYPAIDAILVRQGDETVLEAYFNGFTKDTRHDTRSAFKSITSLLAGIAVDKKLITLDDSLGRFFPELKEETKRKISVRNLLEMRSGLGCEEFYGIGPECEGEMVETDDWVAFCLGVDLVRPPGLNWSYNSNEPMIVGEIIARASGMTVMEFAKRYLFQPLEIEDYQWTVSPKGQGMTAGSFYMRPTDMLKIIDLVANEGKWQGTQVVGADWIAASTDCRIPIDFHLRGIPGYRMPGTKVRVMVSFWYKERLLYKGIDTEVLFASGNGGQYLMLLPDHHLTVVFTGSNYGNWRGKLPFELLLKYIIPALDR